MIRPGLAWSPGHRVQGSRPPELGICANDFSQCRFSGSVMSRDHGPRKPAGGRPSFGSPTQDYQRGFYLGVTTRFASPSLPYFAIEPIFFLQHVEPPEVVPIAVEVGRS